MKPTVIDLFCGADKELMKGPAKRSKKVKELLKGMPVQAQKKLSRDICANHHLESIRRMIKWQDLPS